MKLLSYVTSSLHYNELIAAACFSSTFLTLCVIWVICMKATDTFGRVFFCLRRLFHQPLGALIESRLMNAGNCLTCHGNKAPLTPFSVDSSCFKAV